MFAEQNACLSVFLQPGLPGRSGFVGARPFGVRVALIVRVVVLLFGTVAAGRGQLRHQLVGLGAGDVEPLLVDVGDLDKVFHSEA